MSSRASIAWLVSSGILLGFAAGAPEARASCSWNYDHTFYGCDGIGIVSGVGQGTPSASEAVQANPASIPTIPTPLGVEGIYHSRSDLPGARKMSASLIRGFNGLGLGLSTKSDGSFARPDLRQLFLGSLYGPAYQSFESNRPTAPGFELGTATALPLPLTGIGRLSLGASLGKSPGSSSLSRTLGATWSGPLLHAGFSLAMDRPSSLLPEVRTATLAAGLQLDELSLEVARSAVDASGPRILSSIFSARWKDDLWSVYGALKPTSDQSGNTHLWANGSVQRTFAGRFAIGYIYGFYEHSHSLSSQFYF